MKMSLQTLIRKYIHVHQGKHFVYERMIRDILTVISTEHEVPEDKLFATCEQFLNRSSQVAKCQGFVVSKNNLPCTCPAIENEMYCKRHLYLKEDRTTAGTCIGTLQKGTPCTAKAVHGQYCKRHWSQASSESPPPSVKTRCVGETHEGAQCVRDAQPGNTLCGMHIRKMHNKQLRKKERKPCAFYDQSEDDICFCENHARPGIWFCKTHQHLQPVYASVYKKTHLEEYLRDPIASNTIIEMLLKENGISR